MGVIYCVFNCTSLKHSLHFVALCCTLLYFILTLYSMLLHVHCKGGLQTGWGSERTSYLQITPSDIVHNNLPKQVHWQEWAAYTPCCPLLCVASFLTNNVSDKHSCQHAAWHQTSSCLIYDKFCIATSHGYNHGTFSNTMDCWRLTMKYHQRHARL